MKTIIEAVAFLFLFVALFGYYWQAFVLAAMACALVLMVSESKWTDVYLRWTNRL